MKPDYLIGMEGLSILFTSHRLAGINLWGSATNTDEKPWRISGKASNEPSNSTSSQNSSEPRAEIQPHVSFVLTSIDDESKSSGGKYLTPLSRYTVQLPLTNTTFQNGRESTLVGQAWRIHRDTNGSVKAEKQRERNMQQATIHIQLDDPYTALRPNFCDWHRLTPPRAVAKSAGNVIRSFKSKVGSQEETAASEELEEAVSKRIFIPQQEPPEIYEVWAQVTPKERFAALPRGNIYLDDSLDIGDRFFKVLSGGGGWGNRRGLIALDPDATFDSKGAEIANMDKPFPDLIRPGDVVRFIGAWFPKVNKPWLPRSQPLTRSEDKIPKWIRVMGGTSLRFGATAPLDMQGNSELEICNNEQDHELLKEQDQGLDLQGIPWHVSSSSEQDQELDKGQDRQLKKKQDQQEEAEQKVDDHGSDSDLPYPGWTCQFQSMAAYGHFGALSERGLSVMVDSLASAHDTHIGVEKLGNVVKTKLPPYVGLDYCEVPMRDCLPPLKRRGSMSSGNMKRTFTPGKYKSISRFMSPTQLRQKPVLPSHLLKESEKMMGEGIKRTLMERIEEGIEQGESLRQ